MQAYIDQESNRFVAYNREEVEKCYYTLLEAVKNYGSFYLGEYARYTDELDMQLLIFKIKQTIGIRMKELKNYTGENKKELQELYHSSLVDIRSIEYLFGYLSNCITQYAITDAIDRLYDIPKSESRAKNSHKLAQVSKRPCTFKDGCDHHARTSWTENETEFRPANPDDSEDKNGEFYTVTYKKVTCQMCDGVAYKIISEVITPKLDWDVKLDEINQRARTITESSSIRR